jgi:hypothetical protein
MTKHNRLTLDLVPATCWFSNVRSAVTKYRWDHIKSEVASKAWNVCEICGGAGPKHPVECHEIWFYDDHTLVRKLIGMIALCPSCHGVKHFGYSQSQGRGEEALEHFMKVNDLSREAAELSIKKSFDVWRKRSKKKWTLDISLLSDYGIDVSKVKQRND